MTKMETVTTHNCFVLCIALLWGCNTVEVSPSLRSHVGIRYLRCVQGKTDTNISVGSTSVLGACVPGWVPTCQKFITGNHATDHDT